MNSWAQLAKFDPEEIEAFVEKVFNSYRQAFKPLSINVVREVTIELADGRKVTEKI